jgi:peptidoglycan/LPS O-acetylase OafA/YrhL
MRLREIDALRGLAAAAVVVEHSYGIRGEFPGSAFRWAVGESFGVPLFFAASAYCLYTAMDSHGTCSKQVVAFYVRRLFRIAPLFYSVLALYLGGLYVGRGIPIPWGQVAGTISFTFNFVEGGQSSLVWAGWTIGIEMAFYVVFPLIYLLIKEMRAALLLVVIAIGITEIAYAVTPHLAYDPKAFWNLSIFRYLTTFAAGVVAYHLMPIIRKDCRWGLAALLAAAIATAFWKAGPYGDNRLYGVAVAAGSALVGICLCPLKTLVNRATLFLGRISYSLYLVHPPIIYYSLWMQEYIHALSIPEWIRFALAAILCLFLSLPVAVLVHHAIEKPCNNFGRRVANRLAGRHIAEVPA